MALRTDKMVAAADEAGVLLKALSHPYRLIIVCQLIDKARSVGEGLHDYAGNTPPNDPVLSPLHGDVSGFPPTLLVSSTRDFLLSATAIFDRTLLERGVDARLVVFDGLPHAFWAYMDIPESREANELMANFLKQRLDARSTGR